MLQIKYKDLPALREELMKEQNYICPICAIDLRTLEPKDRCVDHEHYGDKLIRAVLCRRCNAVEGKLHNSYIRTTKKERNTKEDYLNVLKGLIKYKSRPSTIYVHPKGDKNGLRKKKKRSNTKRLLK